MAGFAVPAVIAVLGLGALLLGGGEKGGSKGAPAVSPGERSEYLARMGDTRVSGQPIPHAPAGVTIYQWAWGALPGETTARDFISQSVRAGWVVWADMTVLGRDRFYLALARPGVTPQGSWFILAERESDILSARPGETRVPAGGVSIPVPLPADAVPVTTSADAAKIPGVPGVTVPAGSPAPANTTGLSEIDRLLDAPDATPYQLRQIAAELRKAGKADAAAVVERRASELYSALRVAHISQGGTPFYIKDHHGGASGHLPVNVARHYGGTLAELGKANPGKKQWGDWKIGSTWLLPLSWDAEAKAPPPIASMPAKPATKPAARSAVKPAAPGKVVKA